MGCTPCPVDCSRAVHDCTVEQLDWRRCTCRETDRGPAVNLCGVSASSFGFPGQPYPQYPREFGLTFLFIAHDLSVVEYVSDRVAVMYVGKLVETASTERIFSMPSHPYTEALLSAVPKSEPDQHKERIVLKGETANPADLPSGCYFHPRCHYAEDICRREAPPWVEVAPGHHAACHFAGELTLAAVGSVSS